MELPLHLNFEINQGEYFMKFNKLLATGFALVMALTTAAGLAGCNKDPDQPLDPDDGDTPHVHTFDTSKWESNETMHWHAATCEHTDQKGDLARHSFTNRECTVCHYKQAAEVYLVGHIASHPTSKNPSEFTITGGSLTDVKKNCIKMELAEDGETYQTEVLLSTKDDFRVYEYASKTLFPNALSSSGVRVEEDNGYIVSWKLDEEAPTAKVHDHKYTKWASDANNHWKVCELDEKEPENVQKTPHDFSNGDCECGQKAPEGCQHSSGYVFAYDTLPEAAADGGNLVKTCPDCLGTQDVRYVAGITGAGKLKCSKSANQHEVTADGLYYVRNAAGFKFTIDKAGTYTITFSGEVMKEANRKGVKLYALAISETGYIDSVSLSNGIIGAGKDGTNYSKRDQYGVNIDGYESEGNAQFNSLSITVDEGDLTNGALYVQVAFMICSGTASADNLGYCLNFSVGKSNA